MVTEELFALVDFQSFQSQPQRVHVFMQEIVDSEREGPHFPRQIAFQDTYIYIYIDIIYIYIRLINAYPNQNTPHYF